jgi:hypothetical protein
MKISERQVNNLIRTNSPLIWNRLGNESDQAYEAFALYRDQGPVRSQERVSKELGKTTVLISRWSSKYNWVQRVRAFDQYLDLQVSREAEKRYIKSIAEFRERQRDLALKLSEAAVKLLVKANLRLKNIKIEDIEPDKLPAFYRAAAAVAEAGSNAEAEALAIEKLLMVLQQIETR